MSRRTRCYSFGSLRPGDRVEVFRTEWLEAEVDSVVDSSVRIIFLEQGLSKRKTLHVHDDNFHIPSAISPPHVAVSPRFRPPFLEVDVTDEMQQLQRSSPTKWAMTLAHWNQFIDFCKGTPVWQELKNQEGNVNLYDINERFTIPFTRGTGCSVAVLMNKGTHLEAKLMLSHSWAEDMEECQEAVNIHVDSKNISQDTAVWFCGFALYQPEDGHGPTIQQQLELNPFTTVITSDFVRNGGKMIAVHTSTADLYERLWCVREVDEAIERRIVIGAAFSKKYEEKVSKQYDMAIAAGGLHGDALECAGQVVRAALAKCRDEDKAMLLKEIFRRGSMKRIDEVVTRFRQDHVRPVIDNCMREAAKQGKRNGVDYCMQPQNFTMLNDLLPNIRLILLPSRPSHSDRQAPGLLALAWDGDRQASAKLSQLGYPDEDQALEMILNVIKYYTCFEEDDARREWQKVQSWVDECKQLSTALLDLARQWHTSARGGLQKNQPLALLNRMSEKEMIGAGQALKYWKRWVD